MPLMKTCLESPFQPAPMPVAWLLPANGRHVQAKGSLQRVVYVLPVEADDASEYGSGLAEIARLNLHNQTSGMFVAPTFAQTPWYADHPTEPTIRQESHLVHVVRPWVETVLTGGSGRVEHLLLGFSKSGWGAFSLILRHPHIFSRAAAWDAPLMQAEPSRWGMAEIFATQAHFERYCVRHLLHQQGVHLRSLEPSCPGHSGGPERGASGFAPRLALLGEGIFGEHLHKAHELMVSLQIDHTFCPGPVRRHHWSSGWLPDAVAHLLPDDITRDSH